MSIVPHQMPADHARQLTDRIKGAVEATWQLIVEAYQSRAWAALGYASWDDYCTREFGSSRLKLPREERTDYVASLRDSGMSLRAIESATGVSRPTIIKDTRSRDQVVNSLPPAPVDDSPDVDLSTVDMETGEIHEPADEVSTAEPTPAPKPVTTGIDGKEYSRPAPKAEPDRRRRAPLTDAFFKAAYDLRKNVERLERLVEDDRFTQNREQVALRHENDLTRTAEALTGVLRAINNR